MYILSIYVYACYQVIALPHAKFTFMLLYTTLNLKDCKIIIDHFEIADRFCKYFTNIGPDLARKILQANSSFHTFLTNDINENSPITLDQSNVDELHEICHAQFSVRKSSWAC